LTSFATACREGVLIAVRVTTKAQRNEVAGIVRQADGAEYLSVRVRAAPEHGKANQAVIEAIAKACGIAKSAVRIAAGETSRNKRLLVAGNSEALLTAIDQALGRGGGEAR
jgi:uncharacterized protein (TIGR00251 family)